MSVSGFARDILTNVHVSADRAGMLSVSRGLTQEAVSSSKSLRLPALVATVLFTHISMVSYLEISLLVMLSVTKSPAEAPEAITIFKACEPCFLSLVSRDCVKSPSVASSKVAPQAWILVLLTLCRYSILEIIEMFDGMSNLAWCPSPCSSMFSMGS